MSEGTTQTFAKSSRVTNRLKLYFAMLSCLGGLVLAAGTDSGAIPAFAVFFAIFGFLFVDWLELFALPPIAAYAAMGLAALYCVSDFADMDGPGNQQMIAVAQLLVFVQAILMLQKKSRRIFEQLGVFCLLELVVAAVFNHAIQYGLLLIPIGIVGAWAMSLLAALSATDGLTEHAGLDTTDEQAARRETSSSAIQSSSPESAESLTTAALRLPRVALLTLTPAVLAVAAIFFYALPRTTDAARVRGPGNALVGFNDELNLQQIGEMGQSSEVALRVGITKRTTGENYRINGGLYLRGRVLEKYDTQKYSLGNSGVWSAVHLDATNKTTQLPLEFFSRRSTDDNFYDAVEVAISCERMRSNTLFSVAPFYGLRENRELLYLYDRWTLARPEREGWDYPRVGYSFGTHAFRRGQQTDVIARFAPNRADNDVWKNSVASIDDALYAEGLLDYNEDYVPSARRISQQFVDRFDQERRSDYEIAKALEGYLTSGEDYQYTLKLNKETIPGMDPIEQFLISDKVGHCQFFASSLALMLRSQGIPARIVVGYHTDEYNELTGRYIARQLHAHAWVEALIDADQFDSKRVFYGQPKSNQYWLRLDPTPGLGRLRGDSTGVSNVFDMAQNVWDDYVVDMDARQQRESGILGGGVQPMNGSYNQMVNWLALKISRLRAGELGGGTLAGRSLFSWQAAALTGGLAIIAVLLVRLRAPSWLKRRIQGQGNQGIDRPSISFYAETLDQLARVDVRRDASQTPEELRKVATERLEHPLIPSIADPLGYLTIMFYRLRFGSKGKGQLDLEMPGPIEHARQRSVEVDEALAEIKKSIDLMTVDKK